LRIPELGLLQLHCDIVRHEGLRVVVFTAPPGSTSAKALIAAQRLPLDQPPPNAFAADRAPHWADWPAVRAARRASSRISAGPVSRCLERYGSMKPLLWVW
jgi:hypothetical protein